MYNVTNEIEKKIIELAVIKARTTNKLLPDYNDIINSTIETLVGNKDEFQSILNSVDEYNSNVEMDRMDIILLPYNLTVDIVGDYEIGFQCNIISTIDNSIKKSTTIYSTQMLALKNIDVNEIIRNLNI